ncbi:MAG: glycosyltransferase family 4 protein [Geobacteraceae bacterium]|nr:glycosyltransferase family 4 protein [Geobacteraceae bacterium]
MKILLTTILFLPEYSAGTEVLTYSTAKELQRLGHDVHVLTGFPGEKILPDENRFDSYVHDGIPVSRFRHADVPMGEEWDVLEMEYNNRFVAKWFRAFLEELKPDIVNGFHFARLSASLLGVCHEAGIPVVVVPTDFWFVCPANLLRMPDGSCCKGPDRFSVNCIRHLDYIDKPDEVTVVKKVPDWFIAAVALLSRIGVLPKKRFNFVHALVMRPGFLMNQLNSVAKVIIPSKIMESVLLENGLNRKLVRFSGFGLNLDSIPETVSREINDELRIGFIGSLYEHKGIQILLKAVMLLPITEQITVKIYGKNSEQPDFLAYLEELVAGDDRVSFCGTFPNSRIGEILANIDVLVVPSIWYENTPLVLYSALAAQCPVICSDLGGMSEVVQHMANGLLVEPGNEHALADSLQLLCRDRQLLAKLSAGCKRPKSIRRYVDELMDVYGEILRKD